MKESMPNESRVKKTLLNARVNLLFYFLILALSFFSRKIFLDCLGADFMGFTGTVGSLLGLLNLAELGIGSAIGYILYKPIFEKNHEKINEILSVMGYLYHIIGYIILGGGIILSCFLPLIYPPEETGFSLPLVYFAFYSFLASSLIGYFINYRQNLLGADQRNYIVTAYFQTGNIIKTIIQLVLAYYTRSYYLWLAIELIFGIIYSFILNWKIDKTYPWLKAEVKKGRKLFKEYPEVMRYTRQIFIQRLCPAVAYQVNNFLIYAFVSLSMVTYYVNYTMITDKIRALISNALGGMGASVGNLIAEGDIEKTRKVYFELLVFYIYVSGLVTFGMIALSADFITVWLGKEYIIAFWVIIPLFIHFYFDTISGCNYAFLFGSGLFYDVWASVAEACMCLTIALVCGSKWGLLGILLGRLISSTIINFGWKPYFLFKKGLKLPLYRFWSVFGRLMIIQIGVGILAYMIANKMIPNPSAWHHVIIKGFFLVSIFSVTTTIIFCAINYSFRTLLYERILVMLKLKKKN